MEKLYVVTIAFEMYGNECRVADFAEGRRDEEDLASFDDVIAAELLALKAETGTLPDDATVTVLTYEGDGKAADSDLQLIFTEGKDAFDAKMKRKGYEKKKKNVYHTYTDLWVE